MKQTHSEVIDARCNSQDSDDGEDSVGLHLDFLDKIGESLEKEPLDAEGIKAAKHLEVRHRMREMERK